MPADSVRAAVREVFARREYQWVEPRHPLQWLRDLWQRFVDAMNHLETSNPVVAQIVFWTAVAVLVAILVHFGFIAARIYRATVAGPAAAGGAPVQPSLDAGGHRSRAEALAREGRYTEALAHRFLALLLELDRRDAVQFHASRTPAEYVSDPRLDATGRASLAELVATLYRHVFAAVPCDAAQYRDFGSLADRLLAHVAPR